MIASFVPVQAFATSPDTSEQQATVTAIQLESELSDTSILTAEQQSNASLVPTTLADLKVSNPETFLTSADVENANANGMFSLFSAPSPQGGLPTEANGSKIESLSVSWKTEDDYADNSATRLSLASTDTADRTAVISLEAALSGQRDYAPGDISFTVPSKMFKDRDGNDTGRFRILSNPSFSYTVNADNTYSIVNTVSLPAATSLMMQFAFDGLSPELMCGDGTTASDVFWVDLIVNTEASETGETQDIGMTASGLDATFKTDSKVKDATATVQKLYSNGAYPSTFPASLAPANPENYIYIDWYTYAYMEGNQYFDMDLTSRLSGASGAILLGMKDDKGNVYKNPSASASFTASLDKKAYRTERGYYVHTYAAYPANLTSDVTYTYKLDSTYTMTCVDTKAKTTSAASAEKSYTPKTWETPVGHFGISKYGYETYPMALNDLIAGQDQTARFTLKTLGFGAPFTCKKYYDSNETIPQNELYEMTYKLITDDYATWWNNDTVQLKSADFEFEKLDIERPLTYEYVQFDSTGPGYFNNAEGHIEKGTVEAGDFGYRATDDYPTWQPSIAIYGFKNNDTPGALPDGTPDSPEGNAIKFGEIRWTGLDTYTAKAFNGARFDGTTLYFPSGVTDIRQVAETLAGGCEYYVYPYVKLKANATNIKLAQDLFDNSDVPETYVRNEAKVHALVQQGKYVGQELTHYWEQTNDVIYGGDDTLIGASDGVALDVSAQASEPASANGNYSFTYRVTMKHSTNLTSIAKYNEAVEKGYMADEENGIFYMLLPPGLSLQGSPYMYSGDTVENWRIEKNWRDSGRDMLIVETYSPRDPGYRLASSSVIGKAGYGQEILVGFRGTMTRDDIIEFGTDGRLIAAYQSENTSMGNISGVKGEPDNPLFGNHNESRGAVAGYEDEFTALSGKTGKESPAFVYGRDRTMFALLFAGTAGLTKDVSIDNGATFSRGTGSDELNVYANDTYMYRLRETAGSEDESHVVLYDKFESYAPEGVDSADATWQGTFVSVDTSKLETAGIEPVIYYSTDATLDLNNAAHRNLTDTSRWSKQQPADKTSIKAIAIDGTKTRKGEDYVLKSGHSMTAYVTMRAPLVADLMADAKAQGVDSTASDWYDKTVDNTSAAESGLAGGAHALNGAARTSIIKGASNQFVYTGYTKVGLKPFVMEITKKWNDENDLDGYRPDSVDVDVMASVNGSAPEKVRSVTLRGDTIAGNTWIPVKVDDLPYMDENGNKIEYTLIENMDDATEELYTHSVKIVSALNADGVLKAEITNTHVPDTLSATVKKVWNDEDNYENIRPESVEISVCRKDPDTGTLYYVTGQTKPASAENDWIVTFEGLPQQYNGKYIEYVLYEKQVSGYTASYSINGTVNSFVVTKGAKKFEGVVTNTHTPESMDFTFTKEWEDTNNADRVRPNSINVDVIAHYADGREEVADTVTLTSDGADGNTWAPKTSKKLHLTDTDGSKITYTFAERMGDAEGKYRPVERYQNWNYVTGHTETIITNYHDLDTVSATVQKIWDDENDHDGYRPESVKIYVGRADAPNTYIQMKEATAENNWTVTFDGLPQMRDGKYITYHVFEGYVANYDEPVYSINGGDNQITISPDMKKFSATITNHHEVEMKHFTITKEWDDNDDLDGYRPGYVDVDVVANYIDGKKKVVQTVRLQDKDAEGNTWKPVSTMELPNYDDNGQVITYTFEEKLTGDAAGKYSQTTRFARVAATGEIGVTLTNTHTLDNLSATVMKVWDDGDDCDKVRPESVDISICRVTNGIKYYVQTKAATSENNWTVTFDGLPQQRNGKFIEYVIYEPKQNGYEYPVYSINGGENSIVVEQGMKSFTGTVTNKRTPEQLKFTFTKVWDDGDDHDKMRPNEIQVNVFADGKRLENEQLIMRPTYAGSNTWTTVSTGFLPKHADDGHEIEYTFTESMVGNAEIEIQDYITSFTETGITYITGHGTSSASPQQNIRYTIKNTHPILLATFTGVKQWNDNRNAAGARPSQVIIDVYANGTKVQEIPVTGGAQDAAWEFEVELEALDTNGNAIEYTFEEQPVAGYWLEKVDEDNLIYQNNYYPYGELTIEKNIENATDVSKDTEFSFRVELDVQDGTPVSGTYKWTRSDGVEGEVENGGTVPLRGGQTVTVHQIPSECTYTVTELSSAGWTLNGNQTQTGAVAPKSENKATFSNTYSTSGSAMITAHKSVTGTDLRARQFSFQLLSVSGMGEETVIGTSYNAADGSIAFNPIRYTTEDAGKTFVYKIRENDTGASGYTYDSKVYDCYVDVADNGDGTLSCVPRFELDGKAVDAAAFENTYHAEGQIAPAAHKILKGQELTEGMFEFEMTDSNGNVVSTGRNDAAGVVSFDAISFGESDAGNTYYYTMKEKAGNDSTVIYTDEEYLYEVSVRDMRNGKLSFTTHVYETKAQYDERKVADEATDDASEAVDEENESDEADNVEIIEINGGQYVTADPVFTNDSVPGTLVLKKKVDGVAGQDYDPNAEFTFHVTLDSPGNYEFNREKQKDAWAVYTPDDQTMRFVRAVDEAGALARVGEVRGAAVGEDTQAWTGFENMEAEFVYYDYGGVGVDNPSDLIVPWSGYLMYAPLSCIDFIDVICPKACDGWFNTSGQFLTGHDLQVLNIENLDLSECTLFRNVFNQQKELKEIDANALNVSNCIIIEGVFNGTQIQHLDISQWDTRAAKKIYNTVPYKVIRSVTIGENFVVPLEGDAYSIAPFGMTQLTSASTGIRYEEIIDPWGNIQWGLPLNTADTYIFDSYGYAVYTDSDTLYLTKGWIDQQVGDLYHDEVIVKIYDYTPGSNDSNNVFTWNGLDGVLGQTRQSQSPWYEVASTCKKVVIESPLSATSSNGIRYMFYNFTSLETVEGFENISMPYGTAEYLFYGCDKLMSVNLSGIINTSGTYSGSGYMFKKYISAYNYQDIGNLQQVTLGENTVYPFGSGNYKSYLPAGIWVSQSDGIEYTEQTIPSEKADSYIRKTNAYAIYTSDDKTMRFVRATSENAAKQRVASVRGVEVGTDTQVWTDFEMIEKYTTSWGTEEYTIAPWHIQDSVTWSYPLDENSVECVDFVDKIAPNAIQNWFNNYVNLTNVDHFENLDLSQTTYINGLFANCEKLSQLDTSSVTLEKAETLQEVFAGSGIKELDLSQLDTRHVSTFRSLFGSDHLMTVKLGENFVLDIEFGFESYPFHYNSAVWESESTHETNVYDTANIPFKQGVADTYHNVKNIPLYALYVQDTDTLYFTRQVSEPIAGETINGEIISQVFTPLYDDNFDSSSFSSIAKNVKHIEYLSEAYPTSVTGLFENFTALEDVSNFDKLKDYFFTSSDRLFYHCQSLKEIEIAWGYQEDYTYWTTNSMFEGCSSLECVSFDKSNIKIYSMESMFLDCTSLADVNVKGIHTTSNTYSMKDIFRNCSSLKTLDLSTWDIQIQRNYMGSCSDLFRGCTSLQTLDISGFATGGNNYDNTFSPLTSLTTVTVGNNFIVPCGTYRVGSSTWNYYLPDGIWIAQSDGQEYTEETIPSGKADTYIKKRGAYAAIYQNADASETVLTFSTTQPAQSYDNMTLKATYQDIDMKECSHDDRPWIDYLDKITKVVAIDAVQPTSMKYWFTSASNLREVDLSKADLSKCTDMGRTFRETPVLERIDMSTWDCSSLEDAQQMFSQSGIKEIIFPESGMPAVKQLGTMLDETRQLTTIVNLEKLNASNVTDMSSFITFAPITEIDLSGITLPNTYVEGDWGTYIIDDCPNLQIVHLPTTSAALDVAALIINCGALEQLYLKDGHNYNNFPGTEWGINLSDGVHVYTSNKIPQGQGGTYWKWSWGGNNDVPDDDTGFSPLSLIGNMFNSFVNPPAVNAAENNIEPVYDVNGEPVGALWSAIANGQIHETTNIAHMSAARAAANGDIATGTTGTCTWSLDNGGNLVISPSSGTEGYIQGWGLYSNPPWYANRNDIVSVSFVGKISTNSNACIRSMFAYCTNLVDVNLANFDTSNASIMSYMFESCSSLRTLDVSYLDTSKATELSFMFRGCTNLSEINISGLTHKYISNSTYQRMMFSGCKNLSKVTFSATTDLYQFESTYNYNDWSPFDAWTKNSFPLATGNWYSVAEPTLSLPGKTLWNSLDGNSSYAGTWQLATRQPIYTIKYNANVPDISSHVNGTIDNQVWTFGEDENSIVARNNFEIQGYRFTKWNTEPNGSGITYYPGENVIVEENPKNDVEVVLYAQWESTSIDASRGEFDVTLHPNETLTIPDVPAGTTYTVTENTPSGWSQVASGTVGTDGKILPASTSTATIQNEYSTGKTVANIMAKKLIGNNIPTSDQLMSSDGTPYFTFDLFESDTQGNAVSTQPMSTASANAAGAIVFDPIEYNSVSDITNGDDHYYVIKERSNIITDPYYDYAENLVAKVHVSDDGKGYLSNEIEYIGGSNVMNNVSKPARLTIEKNTEGNVDALPDSIFTFEVTLTSPQGDVDVRRVEIQGKGRATIEDIPLGTTYSVREIDIPSGWKNTNNTDTITGSFAVGKDIEQSATFTNTYTASPVSVMFEASKHMADGSSIQAGQFEFCLYDSTDTPDATKPADTATPIQTKTNAEDGTITFDMMTFTRPGTYVYLMTEKAGSNPDISYDTHVEKIVVNVTDDGHGRLMATTSYDADGDGILSFENSYRSGMLEITKTAINATSQALDNMEYSFTIHMSDAQGNALSDMPYKKMQAGEDGTWTEIESECVSDGDVVVMRTDQKIAVEIPARSKWEITENVPDGFQAENDTIRGTIEHAGTDNPSIAHFVNRYFATGALQFSANKIAEGFTLAESQFSFVLNGGEYVAGSYRDDIDMPAVEDDDENGNDSDNEGAVDGTHKNVTPSTYASSTQTYESRNTEDGKIVFPALTYTQSDDGKQFVYTIVESNDGAKNIAYDSRQYKLIVNVTDNGNGTVRADAYLSDAAKMKLDSDGRIDVSNMTSLDESDEMQFVNVYATALPFTGGAGLPTIIVIIGLVLTIGGMGIIYITNRKRPSNKNNRQGNKKQ